MTKLEKQVTLLQDQGRETGEELKNKKTKSDLWTERDGEKHRRRWRDTE